MNVRRDPSWLFLHRAARSGVHDLDDPASGRAGAARDGQQFTAVRSFAPVVFEADEDAILAVHGRPALEGEAALRRRGEP